MASRKAVVAARMALIAVYRKAAEEALPREQLDLLYGALESFDDCVVELGVKKMILNQDNIWKDGMSIYSVLRGWCKQARVDMSGQMAELEQSQRRLAWNAWLDEQNAEDSAIGRHSVRLLASGRIKEAQEFIQLEREEKLRLLPDAAIKKAGEYLAELRRKGPPATFQLPETTDASSD